MIDTAKKTGSSTNGFHRSPVARKWVHEMTGALRSYDVYDHLVTNHYATDRRWIDTELAIAKTESGAPLYDIGCAGQ